MLFKVASQNWEERSLKWAPNIRLSHVCLGGKKKCLLVFFSCGFLLPLHGDCVQVLCCDPLEIL